MVLHGVIARESATLRFYECESPETAQRLYDAMAEFDVVMRVDWITRKTVVIKGLKSGVRLGRAFIRHLLELLHREGVRHLLVERGPEHIVPYGRYIRRGPLAGMWRVRVIDKRLLLNRLDSGRCDGEK